MLSAADSPIDSREGLVTQETAILSPGGLYVRKAQTRQGKRNPFPEKK
jgi:hypothetical protein